MRTPNYLVTVFVNGKCADIFYSEDLCELHVCRTLYSGCEIEVHDMRSFIPMSDDNVRWHERESKRLTERRFIPEQVVCVETKKIFPSLSICAYEIGETLGALMDSIAQLSSLGGRHYLMSSDLFNEKE